MIDFLKLVFSLAVIGIHIQLFKDTDVFLYRSLTMGLFRIGVPFYFIVSGYFFASKLHDKAASDRYIRNLVKIYLVFELIELPFMALAMKMPLTYVIWKFFTTGMNGIYWYLISLILTCLICRPFWKDEKTGILIVLGAALYLLAMTSDSLSWLFDGTALQRLGRIHTDFWRWPQAGFAESVLFLSLGVRLRQKPVRIPHNAIILCASLTILLVEAHISQTHGAYDANCYVSMPAAAVLLFTWVLEHPKAPVYHPSMRDLSLYMYMIQPLTNMIGQSLGRGSLIAFAVSVILDPLISCTVISVMHRRKLTNK